MLSLFKVTPEMGAHYFSKEDYYSQEKGPAQPEFFGNGCRLLGIKSEFNQVTFQRLIEGKSPSNENLRIIKSKQFDKKGRNSFGNISNNFIRLMESNKINIDQDYLNKCLNEVTKYQNIDVKYENNKEKILSSINEHPVTKSYSDKKKIKLMKSLMLEACELGTLSGKKISTLPENYVAFEHKTFGKIAHKLIDRHLYLKNKDARDLEGYSLYYEAFKKYYPVLAQGVVDYKTSKESRESLAILIKKAPVIGLWNDENIIKEVLKPNPNFDFQIDKKKRKYISDNLEKIKKKQDFDFDKIGKVFEKADELFKNTLPEVSTKSSISFEDFCKNHSPDEEIIDDKLSQRATPNVELKSHLNKFQAKILKDLLLEKVSPKSKNENLLIKKFVKSISKTSDRAGLDLTFSAPKSVSITALVGGDRELLEAHKKAVKFTLSYIEKNYIGTRSGSKEDRVFETTKNLTSALFHHGTTREQDPQLHTHCVILNTTMDSKGKWKSIHNDKIFSDRNLLGSIYRKKYADLIKEIGYKVIPYSNGLFEIDGFSDKQLQFFSKRSKQIEKVIIDNNMSKTSESKANAVLIGRKSKMTLPPSQMMDKWQLEAREINLKIPKKELSTPTLRTNWKFACEHIQEKESVWSQEKLLKETINANINRGSIESILKNYKQKSEVILVQSNGKKIGLTNNKIIQNEERIISYMKYGRSKLQPISDNYCVKSLEKDRGFTKGQSNAFKLAITCQDQFMAWIGVAGSGKSYALKDVKEVAEANKYKVIGLAPDGTTANTLFSSTGIKTKTIDKFLLQNMQKCSSPQLWVIDEAGKISTEKMLLLMKKAKENENTKVLFSGDPRQIGAVNAGSPLSLLINNGILKVELNEHRRQIDKSLRSAVEMASDKKLIAQSVQALNNNTAELKTRKSRINRLVRTYSQMPENEKENTLILTDLNQDRLDLTYEIRRELKKNGTLGTNDTVTKILRSKDISDSQKKLYWSYNKGDILIPYKDIENTVLKKDYQYKVENINRKTGKLTLTNGDFKTYISPKQVNDFTIYNESEILVTRGDKLQFTKNYKGNTNRQIVTVKEVKEGEIHFKEINDKLKLTRNHHLDHALVQTTYSSQGQTSKNVIFLAESRVSSETWYVGISRAKENIHIITDNKEKLQKRVTKSQRKLNALDFKVGEEPIPIRAPRKQEIDYGVSL